MSALNIYRASAGSGKTFALTLEYFKIIFANPGEYRNILAVTFTNKATEEMKSRIINELHRLAEGRESSYGMLLKEEFGFNAEQLRNRAMALRTMLLHDYGRISVTTIDRFFQRIIKSFTRELGIFPGYNVELDSDYVLLKAIDKLMEQVKSNSDLRCWISELMETNVDEGKSWSIKSKIAELGGELFKENYMLFDKQILNKFNDKNFLKTYRDFLHKTIRGYEEELLTLSREAIEIIERENLKLQDFRKNGSASHFYKIQSRKFDDVTTTVRNGLDNIDFWITKSCDTGIKAKIESIFPHLNQLLKACIRIYDTQYKGYLSARQLSANLYQLGILNDLYREVREYCDDKGLMLLSDTTHILNILIEGNDTSFLFEKVGNYFKHLMIDEFQDTSALQWRNFRPLVVNCLSEGNKAVIVGDVKQSIYRWRNGDWSLLAGGVEQEFRQLGTKKIELKDNWRSAQEIVDFNNLFFNKAAIELKSLYDEAAGAGNLWSLAIEEAYSQSGQTVRSGIQGYVDIAFGPAQKEEKSDEYLMDTVADIIQDIVQRGGQARDIVILVRTAKEGAFVARYLMEYNKTAAKAIDFISNDSLYVWSSPYIKFIVSVLHYLSEPFDVVNKAVLLYLYHSFVRTEEAFELDRVFKSAREEDIFQFLDTDFTFTSGKLMSYSLYETIEAIIAKFDLRNKREEVPYLIAFQDIVYDYEANNSNSLVLFLEWWEKEQGKKVLSTSEEVNAVRILTIHKSKGLEFGYVILPFCSWELDSTRPVRRIWCSNHEKDFDRLDYAPLNYSAKLADTIFEEAYFSEHLKAYVDNLNLLYVALTRAKRELYVRPYGPKINKDGRISLSDIGAFIYRILERLQQEEPGRFRTDERLNLQYGKKGCFEVSGTDAMPLALADYPVYDSGEKIRVKYKYQDYASLDSHPVSALDEGKLLHEIFRSIRYTEDIDQAVKDAYLSGLIAKEDKDKYREIIKSYVSKPGVASWFDKKYEIINERDILFHSGKKSRPDRVVCDGEKAIVIDYKFGMKENTAYNRQVQFYCDTLKQMNYKEVRGYIWYVTLQKIIELA